MASELDGKQVDLDRLHADFAQFEATSEAKNAEQGRQMRAQYEVKVESLRNQIGVMEQAQREQRKIVQGNSIAEKQVGKLTDEIEKLHLHGKSLKIKMQGDSERYELQHEVKENELAGLRNEAERFAKQIRELESENSRQRQVGPCHISESPASELSVKSAVIS